MSALDEIELTALISEVDVGYLIGPKGSFLRDFRTKYNVSITLPPKEVPSQGGEKQFTLRGYYHDVFACCQGTE